MTISILPSSTEACTGGDVLSRVLQTIRVTGHLTYCFEASGDWRTDAAPGACPPPAAIPFHIVAEGTCWVQMQERTIELEAGDIIVFPFGADHRLGAGEGTRLIDPSADFPPQPWSRVPVLRYGEDPRRVRLLSGHLQPETTQFRLLARMLPDFILARTACAEDCGWLAATLRQALAEVERPTVCGMSMLARLTEIALIELLRREINTARPDSRHSLAALAEPSLGRCLARIHDDPARDWSVRDLAAESGLSRSALIERFGTMLDTSPMRYVRDWRLHLASVALSTTETNLATIALEAGYGTEAAFSRAFSRCFGAPPALWRQRARGRRRPSQAA